MARTKGSKNGISRTKGYTAVGQRAKGRYVNGKWVYDGKYGSVSGNFKEGFSYERKSPININPYAETNKKKYDAMKKASAQGAKNNWQQQANGAQAYDMFSKKFSAAKKAKNYQDTLAKGAAMGDAAKAADAQRKAEAKARWQAGNKAMAANKAKEQGAQNNWQQRANAKRDDVETYRKYKRNEIGGVASTDKNGNVFAMYHPKAGYTGFKTIKESASSKAKEQGAKNNWQQQAALEQWKQQNRNNISAKKKAEATKGTVANASKAGEKNNWQQQANKKAARSQYVNMVVDDHAAIKKNSEKKMASPQKNAMRKDPRYSTGLGTVTFMTSGQRDKYDYSGKRDDRAPTFHAIGKKPEKMDRTPYWDHMANATNKQELAKALAKSKEFMNDFRKSKIRNSRSDIGNALADAKEDARKAWKKLFSKKKKKK